MGKKYINKIKKPKNEKEMKVDKKFLEPGLSNRTGKKQVPEYIVIHEVSTRLGRAPKEYNMQHYSNKIRNDAIERNTTVGYHFLCGDKEVYQFLPEDEAIDHTGTKEGNHNSIGIERLINKEVNFAEALYNQAKLTATLMKKWNIPIENVKPHRAMQWKYTPEREDKTPCPERMLSGWYGGWKRFILEVERCTKYGWYFEDLLNEKKITAKDFKRIYKIESKNIEAKVNANSETKIKKEMDYYQEER